MYFESDTVKSACPMQENILYRLLVYLTSLTVCSGDKKKKSSENDQSSGDFQRFFFVPSPPPPPTNPKS